jgi:hypothetical protein
LSPLPLPPLLLLLPLLLLQSMFNDKSMLQYGFLQSGPVASLVHGLDRHDFASNPRLSESKRQLPSPFKGTSAELLSALLHTHYTVSDVKVSN